MGSLYTKKGNLQHLLRHCEFKNEFHTLSLVQYMVSREIFPRILIIINNL